MLYHSALKCKYNFFFKRLFLITVIVLVPFVSFPQDINFTMFNNCPLFLNPGNTGNYIGDWRIAGNFRNQWGSASDPFRTVSISIDNHFFIFNQQISAGLFFINDGSGIGKLTYNEIYGSVAYEKNIKRNYVSFGLQVGYVLGSINDWLNWDPVTGTFTLPSGEPVLDLDISYLDVNTGIIWKRSIGICEPEAGIAFFHVNFPKKTYIEDETREDLKTALHGKVKIKCNDKIYIQPAVLLFGKSNSTLTIAGSNVGYNIPGNTTRVKQIYAGLYMRNGIMTRFDSFAGLVGTTVGRLDITASYDMNITSLSRSGLSGALEISFIYKSISTVLNSYSIPCERY